MEIIAEIGQNHNGDMNLAIELIKEAKLNGADVAKFQLYNAKKLFPKKGNVWYEYNCKTEISKKDFYRLVEACDKYDIEFMASVFDEERVEWLEEVDVKRYKIASRTINDKSLIKKISSTKKEVLVSLGMWNEKSLPDLPIENIKFLYCKSIYPTPISLYNFNEIDFNIYDGFSDHSIGITASKIALARGANIIEKHFTLSRGMYGPDHICSITPTELNELTRFTKELEYCLK
jgi:sialic acid synthase SpsE